MLNIKHSQLLNVKLKKYLKYKKSASNHIFFIKKLLF